MTFRAEGFNFINHPNWNGADSNPNNYTATFGKVTGKSGERTIQLSLRYAVLRGQPVTFGVSGSRYDKVP